SFILAVFFVFTTFFSFGRRRSGQLTSGNNDSLWMRQGNGQCLPTVLRQVAAQVFQWRRPARRCFCCMEQQQGSLGNAALGRAKKCQYFSSRGVEPPRVICTCLCQ